MRHFHSDARCVVIEAGAFLSSKMEDTYTSVTSSKEMSSETTTSSSDDDQEPRSSSTLTSTV